MYAVNYEGLKKRSDYDELVDFILFKQPKIKYPDRTAKFIRSSPQLSNLLDGDGMGIEELKQQQLNKMKEDAKENAIIQAASSSGGTASHLRAVDRKTQTDKIKSAVGGTQTLNPKMTDTGMQAWRPNVASAGTQSDNAQYFDISMEEKIADVNEQIEMELDDVKQKPRRTKGKYIKNTCITFRGSNTATNRFRTSNSTATKFITIKLKWTNDNAIRFITIKLKWTNDSH